MSCHKYEMRIEVDVGYQNYMKQCKGFGNSNTSHKKSVAQDYLTVGCSELVSIPLAQEYACSESIKW